MAAKKCSCGRSLLECQDCGKVFCKICDIDHSKGASVCPECGIFVTKMCSDQAYDTRIKLGQIHE